MKNILHRHTQRVESEYRYKHLVTFVAGYKNARLPHQVNLRQYKKMSTGQRPQSNFSFLRQKCRHNFFPYIDY